mmetsp:Transcript_33332/g.68027  ORF Transcript_33332/g.68027 Transcript_33332/m.68027 type:complete len:80 (+) Transcript_33332:279-518(+)
MHNQKQGSSDCLSSQSLLDSLTGFQCPARMSRIFRFCSNKAAVSFKKENAFWRNYKSFHCSGHKSSSTPMCCRNMPPKC